MKKIAFVTLMALTSTLYAGDVEEVENIRRSFDTFDTDEYCPIYEEEPGYARIRMLVIKDSLWHVDEMLIDIQEELQLIDKMVGGQDYDYYRTY